MNKNDNMLLSAIFLLLIGFIESEVTPCTKLPEVVTFKYGSKPSFDVCLKAKQRPTLVYKFADGNETLVNEIISQDNQRERYHFKINLPKLQEKHCGNVLILRYSGGGKEMFGEHRLTVVVIDIPLDVNLLTYHYDGRVTKITWTPINTGGCQAVKYFIRIQEFSGDFEKFGPISNTSWETNQLISPHRMSVYAKDGSREGKPSIDLFKISGDQINTVQKTNPRSSSQAGFSSYVWIGITAGVSLFMALITFFVTYLLYRKRMKRRAPSAKYVNSYTDLPENYHLENRTQTGLSGKYASLSYVQPNKLSNRIEECDELPTDNGYELNDSYYEVNPK
ncbi:uncharacterized protein [Clytia hemisphaerica]|uniref:uncharacterized protein n=1 Tax=Clytia hemisphaerica TaxID=252671 RepID=UPI0034D6D665